MRRALINLGIDYHYNNEPILTIETLLLSKEYFHEIDYSLGLAKCYDNLGLIYSSFSDYKNSLIYFKKALTINEQLNNVEGIGFTLHNNAGIFSYTNDDQTALEYCFKALKIYENLKNNNYLFSLYGNIAHVYMRLSDFENAKIYINKSINLNLE
ncbi:MAG: tetratricopeptide repeat protein [Candidatus Kapaibacterium sp.]